MAGNARVAIDVPTSIAVSARIVPVPSAETYIQPVTIAYPGPMASAALIALKNETAGAGNSACG